MAKQPRRRNKTSKSSQAGHRRSHRTSNSEQPAPGEIEDFLSLRMEMEQQMAQLGKLLGEREFDSIEEVNEFLEKMLAETGGVIPSTEPETPLEEAQALVYQAWQSESPRKAVKLARQALKISEDCADAYLLLGDLAAETMEEARQYYEKAIAAAERALGPEIFDEGKGHFWGITETRPYMRARAQLADLLWELGQAEEAIDHYRAMLELNPGDNQGIRYLLLDCLLQLCRNDEAETLLNEYDDAMAAWHYNQALLTFRRQGRSPSADEALNTALEQNEYVPDYLLGMADISLDGDLPDHHGWGDENEAIIYASRGILLWAQTPGAQRWLAERLEEWG